MLVGVDLTVEYAFKHLFGREATRPILVDLLNQVLVPAPGHDIRRSCRAALPAAGGSWPVGEGTFVFAGAERIQYRSQQEKNMIFLLSRAGLRYNETAIAAGAQTERRLGAPATRCRGSAGRRGLAWR
jgi:hypothetical protein